MMKQLKTMLLIIAGSILLSVTLIMLEVLK